MYKIIVNNTDIIGYCGNIGWNGDSDSLGIQLNFVSIKEIPNGTVVQIFNDNTEIFRGIALKPTKKRFVYSYVCQDYSYYLKNNKVDIKQFNGMTTSDAIGSLVSENYLTYSIPTIPTVINKFYSNKSYSDMIDDILSIAESDQGTSYFYEIIGDVFYIYDTSSDAMRIAPKILMPKDIEIEMSMENMKNRITVISGTDENAVIQAIAEDKSQQSFYGILSDVKTVDNNNIAQAQNIANNELSTNNKISYSSNFDIVALDDNADFIRPNRYIYLSARTHLSAGYYKIKTANHTLGNENLHKVSLQITW
jgi:hypothetical protein